MKAAVMAGGRGTRLYPLTTDFPKPLIPLMGRPILDYLFDVLHGHRIEEVVVTLNYGSDQIIDVLSRQDRPGMSVRWAIEDVPLGTAGGIKNIEACLDETFLVVSGDLVTTADLDAAVSFHHKRKALVTILMTKVDDITRYGMIRTAPDGRIEQFCEKPAPGDPIFSSMGNAGIYVIEPEALDCIPSETFFDFSGDLFPLLLGRGLPLYACELRGYWRDLGSLKEYWQSHWDVMQGTVRLNCDYHRCQVRSAERAAGQSVVVEETSNLHETVAVSGPAYVGPGVHVDRGAEIGPYAFVGPHARVLRGARIVGSILNEYVVVGEESQVQQSVVGRGTRLPHHSHLRGAAIQGYQTSDILDLPAEKSLSLVRGRSAALRV